MSMMRMCFTAVLDHVHFTTYNDWGIIVSPQHYRLLSGLCPIANGNMDVIVL